MIKLDRFNRSRLRPVLCCAGCAAGVLAGHSPRAAGQTSTVQMWEKIYKADAAVKASNVEWKSVYIQQPQPGLDVEKQLASTQASWEQQGVGASNIAQLTRAHRQIFVRDKAGWQKSSLLALIRQGAATRCEIFSAPSTRIGAPASVLPASIEFPDYIEFYDGRDAINVSRAVPQKGQTVAQALLVGNLHRNSDSILPHVGLENAPLLTGAKLFSDYSAANSSLSKLDQDTVALEKRVQEDYGEPITVVTRWAVSRSTWRPTLMEKRWDTADGQKPFLRIRFSNYQLRSPGVWFPDSIVREELDRSGEARIQQSYQLLKAEFNESVDPLPLTRPLPKGTILSDYRFAPRPNANYQIVDRIPDDKTVLDQIKQREEQRSAQLSAPKGSPATKVVALSFGVLLMTLGLLLWVRPQRQIPH